MKQTVLVIGAAGGVGLALTKLLITKNYHVIGSVLDDQQAQEVRSQAPGVGKLVKIDLSHSDDLAASLTPALNEPDVVLAGVVVCAAITPHGPLETASLQGLRKTIEINTIAGLAAFQTCMPHLRKTKGKVVLISSEAGRIGIPFLGHYVASKYALEGLCDVMRREVARFGVSVVLVEPGALKTPMTFNSNASIRHDMSLLSPEELSLYGDLYRGFLSITGGASTSGTDPETVADIILEALESETPQTRYQVGQDAIDFINMAKASTDRQIDDVFAAIFAQAQMAQSSGPGKNILQPN
jgi:NAD(P)-dependent dehydrogenase (short-subunit alcohol dehydrogenase family)